MKLPSAGAAAARGAILRCPVGLGSLMCVAYLDT